MNIKQASDYLNENGAKSLIEYLSTEAEKYHSQLSEFGEDEKNDEIATKNASVLRIFEDDLDSEEDELNGVRKISALLADETFITVQSNKHQIIILQHLK